MRRISLSFMVALLRVLGGVSAVLAQGGNIYVVPSPVTCATPVATPAAGGCAAINPTPTIVTFDLGFTPNAFTIPADVPVTITIHNSGVALHNFSVDKLKIWLDVLPGETKQVTVTAPAGDYPIYCDVPGHKQAGMVGLLRVR
jgi:uncharacterized cupredoxin-like copper-binding protein